MEAVKHWPCERTATLQPLVSLTSNSSSAQGLEIMQEQNDIMSRVLRVLQEPDVELTCTPLFIFFKPSDATQRGCDQRMWMLQSVTCYNQIECERGRRRWRGRCKRHASLHSWIQEELRRCSVCLTRVKWQHVNKRFVTLQTFSCLHSVLRASATDCAKASDALLQPSTAGDSHGGCTRLIIQWEHGGRLKQMKKQLNKSAH